MENPNPLNPQEENNPAVVESGPDEAQTFWAFTSYLIFFLPLLSKRRDDDFVNYHFRQGFVFFLILVLIKLIVIFIDSFFLKMLIYLAIFVLWCFGVAYSLLGEKKPIPLIGKLAISKKF